MRPDGKVVVFNGNTGPSSTAQNLELYDPAAGTFQAAGTFPLNLFLPATVLLNNGKLLIAGGENLNNFQVSTFGVLYTVSSGTFALTGSLQSARLGASASLLDGGKALVYGGNGGGTGQATFEIYDPGAATFGSLTNAGTPNDSAVKTLPNGLLLLAGGTQPYPGTGLSSSTELIDPLGIKLTGPAGNAN